MTETTNVEYLGYSFSEMLHANLVSQIQKEWIKKIEWVEKRVTGILREQKACLTSSN